MHTDGTDVALVRAADGKYGQHVTFALVHPGDLRNPVHSSTSTRRSFAAVTSTAVRCW
jgi:hypothetical protein